MPPPTDAPADPASPADDRALAAALDRMLGERPELDTETFSHTLAALCDARDRTADAERRSALNRLVSLVMAVKHPLGAPPWDALAAACAPLSPQAGSGRVAPRR